MNRGFKDFHEGEEFQIRWFEDKYGGGVYRKRIETLERARECLKEAMKAPREFPNATYKIVRVTVQVLDAITDHANTGGKTR